MPKIMMPYVLIASFMGSVRNAEYQFLEWLCAHRTELLTLFFFSMTVLGSKYLYLFLIPTLFACIAREKAYSYAKLILAALIINALLKEFFSVVRPSSILVEPLYTSFAKGFSFPSGHAQMSLLLGGLLIMRFRKSCAISAAIAGVILSVSFSRLYLAAHFPADIIGGWITGLSILTVYMTARKNNISIPNIVVFIICALLLFFSPTDRITTLCATLAGLCGGMMLQKGIHGDIHTLSSNKFLYLFIMFVGNTLAAAFCKALHLPEILEFSLQGFWISYLFFLSLKFFKKSTERV